LKVESENHLNGEIASGWGAAVLRPYGEWVMAESAMQSLLLAESLFDLGGYFQCECVQALGQVFYVLQELIVENYGGNGGDQTGRSGQQRFGDSGGDGAKAGGAGVAETGEGVNDAPHRTEETYEWGYRAGGGEPRHSSFSTRRTSSALATCMFAVTAPKLFNFGGCGLVG